MRRLVSYNNDEYTIYSIIETEEPILIHISEMERMIKLYQKYDSFRTAPDDEKVEFTQMVFNSDKNAWEQGKFGGVISVNLIRAEWVAYQ